MRSLPHPIAIVFVTLLVVSLLVPAVGAHAAGASCTTPYGNKVVSDGGTISYEPYFTQGVFTGSVIVPMMKCSNGAWLTCDYAGNNCGNGAPTGTTQPGTLPSPTRTNIPKADPNPIQTTPTPTQTNPSVPTFSPPQVFCSLIYSPVCGTNGITYSNSCVAQTAGASVAHTGACATSGTTVVQPTAPVYGGPISAASLNRSATLLSAALTRADGLVARIDSRVGKLGSLSAQLQQDLDTLHTELAAAHAALDGVISADSLRNANMHLHGTMSAIQQVLFDIRVSQ